LVLISKDIFLKKEDIGYIERMDKKKKKKKKKQMDADQEIGDNTEIDFYG